MAAAVNDTRTYFKEPAIAELRKDRELVVLRRATAQVSADAVVSLMPGLLSHELVEISAQELRARVARQVFGGPVHSDDLAFQIVQKDDVIGIFEELPESFFAGP